MLDLRTPLNTGWNHVSSEYGPRKPIKLPNGTTTRGFHTGIDFAVPQGTPVYAIADGRVIDSGWAGDYGNHISIRHKESGPRLSSGYSHLRDRPLVASGKTVKKGQLIGYVGTTGASTGPHLHHETYVDGSEVDPRQFYAKYGAPNLTPTQRLVGPDGVRRRIGSPSTAAPEGEMLNPGDIANLKGYANGQRVDGLNLWYVGISGDYFHCSGFVPPHSASGLQNLTPAPALEPTQRKTTDALFGRAEPSVNAKVNQVLEPGAIGNFVGWRNGDTVEGEKRWLQGISGDWFSLRYLEPRNTTGLKDLNPVNPEPPKPGLTEEDVTPAMVTPSQEHFPAWIRYEVVLDPEHQNGSPNLKWYEYYDKTLYEPIESHTHWWNEPGKGGTHDANVNYLKNTSDLSTNYVTSENRITLMVPLDKLALTTGRRNPYGWKSENDPTLTDQGYVTLGYLHYIVEKLNPQLQGSPIRLHKEFTATSCAGIDRERVRKIAEEFRTGARDVTTGKLVDEPVDPPEEEDYVKVPVKRYNKLKLLVRELSNFIDDLDEIV